MNPAAARGFCCPICRRPLSLEEKRLACPGGHSFDLAREGYVNLLPVQKKKTKDPGDSREMVQARREFLSAGHYLPFARALGQICADLAQNSPAFNLVDAGCGEGYYDRAVLEALRQTKAEPRLLGFDISRQAVRLAARGPMPEAAFAVGSCFSAPVLTGWADAVVDVFAPFAREEFLRMLKPGGWLVYAVPGPDHLFGLKEVLYSSPYRNLLQQVEYPGFVRRGEKEVSAEITLTGSQIPNLFAMTPYYWKTPREGAQRLQQLESLSTPIQFRFLIYQKEA